MSDVVFSVIIVSYKNLDIIIDCIESIYQYNDIGSKLEIILVDNSPDDRIYSYVKETYPEVLAIKNDNKGYGHGNNIGVINSNGDYLLFLNPDTILVEPIFNFAIEKFINDQGLGLFGLKLVDNQRHKNLSYYFMDRSGFIAGLINNTLSKLDIYLNGQMFIAGADIFIRRAVFLSVGMFDENIFMYCEEADLTRRVLSIGYNTKYFKDRSIIHLEGKASNNLIDSTKRRLESKKYYCEKYNLSFRKQIKQEISFNRVLMLIPFYKNKDEKIAIKNHIYILKMTISKQD